MRNSDMNFFMNQDLESKFEDVEISGISKFKYPQGHEEAGKTIPWILKPITTSALDELREQNTSVRKLSDGKKDKVVDEKRMTYEMMIETIQYPNFKDAMWLESAKLVDPVDLLKKVLDKPGDFGRISKECCSVNGIGVSEEELVSEAKNS